MSHPAALLNNSHVSKLDSARLLILGMEGLLPDGMLPVSRGAIADVATPADAFEQQEIAATLTRAVLYPIVVELVVKHLWEQRHRKTAPYHHNVRRLFQGLRQETQREIVALYDRCCVAYKAAIEAGKRQFGPEFVAADMATLEEALQWNKDAVKNLKYEMTPRGRNLPIGIFWSGDHYWIVPNTFPNFAIELTRWARRGEVPPAGVAAR